MSILDDIFGDGGEGAAKEQRRANTRAQRFIEQQARRARNDAMQLQGLVDQSLYGGYQNAIAALQGAYPAQIHAMQAGNMNAQNALLGGLQAQQQALLGQPIDYSRIKYRRLPMGQAQVFQDIGMPEQQQVDYAALLSGLSPEAGKTTNRELAQRAYQSGVIDDEQYELLHKNLDRTGAGGSTHWATQDPSKLYQEIGTQSKVNTEFRKALETLFSGL